MVVNQTTANVHGKAIQPIHTHYKSIVVTEYSTFYKTIMSSLLMVAKGSTTTVKSVLIQQHFDSEKEKSKIGQEHIIAIRDYSP